MFLSVFNSIKVFFKADTGWYKVVQAGIEGYFSTIDLYKIIQNMIKIKLTSFYIVLLNKFFSLSPRHEASIVSCIVKSIVWIFQNACPFSVAILFQAHLNELIFFLCKWLFLLPDIGYPLICVFLGVCIRNGEFIC